MTLFVTPSCSDRSSQRHRPAGRGQQGGRTGPGGDLEEGLPVSVVQDYRWRRLGSAVPQRWRLLWENCGRERRRCRRDHDRPHGRHADESCFCDGADGDRIASYWDANHTRAHGLRHCSAEQPKHAAAAAAGRTSMPGTLKVEPSTSRFGLEVQPY